MLIDAIGNIKYRDTVSVMQWMAMNLALSTAAVITPQGGAYPWPAAAAQPTLVSSSANDAAAGTGARTVQVDYLDENYAEQSEIVTLNGTTAVTMTADDVIRVNDMTVLTAGSGGVTAGNLSLKISSDTIAYIAAGNNCSRQGVFTVPAGKRLVIDGFKVAVTHTAANKRAIIGLRKRVGGSLFSSAWETALTDGFAPEDLKHPLVFEEKTDVFFNGVSDGTATVHVYTEGWIE